MQMSFFDFEEFNELKAEAKKKEAPRKKKEEKQKKKSAPKTVYKLPLTLKSIAGESGDDGGNGNRGRSEAVSGRAGPILCNL